MSRAGTSSSAPSTRTRRSRRARACSAWSCARCRSDDELRHAHATCRSTTSRASSRRSARRRSRRSIPCASSPSVAHAAGAWLHVDAAYAGSSWICEEERWSQDGVELADSLVVNPHKWLLVPMDCSLLWTSRPDEFRQAFSLVPEYLRTPEDVYALSEYGPALGRRFRSLKLWAVLRCFGAEGLRAIQREHMRLAELFAGVGRGRPGLGARRAAAVLARRLPAERHGRGERGDPRAREPRAVRCFSRTRSSTAATSCGSQSATRARRRRTCAAPGRC